MILYMYKLKNNKIIIYSLKIICDNNKNIPT